VVAEYYSCGLDWACGIKGDEDFLEMLKIAASMRDSANENVDFNYGISASGHSSGARAALMIAAARDTDDYLPDRIKDKITPSMSDMLEILAAVIPNHPDGMYDPTNHENPNVPGFAISETPTLILTGEWDYVELEGSAFRDWNNITSPSRVYMNVAHARHGECSDHKPPRGAPISTDFLSCHVKADKESCSRIYDSEAESYYGAAEYLAQGDHARNNAIVTTADGEEISTPYVASHRTAAIDKSGNKSDNGRL